MSDLVREVSTFAMRSGVLTMLAVLAAVALVAERLWPARAADGRRRLNLGVWAASMAGQVAFAPAFGGVATLAVNAAGGGLIVLPAHGWGLALGAAAYLAAMDLGEYLFHRAQHAAPALWAMHALHHSDRSFDATTALRHFWAEPLLKSVTIWLAVGLLFKAPPAVVAVYAAVSYWHIAVHSNTRLDLGRWSFLLNAPAYHRLHHSASPEHYDVNFAALLPVFDVLSGAYRPARPGERPATGLADGDEPRSLLEAVGWPLRRLLRGAPAGRRIVARP